jgi:nicotinamidase/pyrazinamidase
MRVLILVDIQNDFLPGGALAVPNGADVIPVANALAPKFDCVVATQDWHPVSHESFAANQPAGSAREDSWPVHCVQGSAGAELAAELDQRFIRHVVRKGTDARVDSYSGFFDNDHKTSTGLADYLREIGTSEVFVLGLATDYCVQATAVDAARIGFSTWVVVDGCRGIAQGDLEIQRTWDELQSAGVQLTRSCEVQ